MCAAIFDHTVRAAISRPIPQEHFNRQFRNMPEDKNSELRKAILIITGKFGKYIQEGVSGYDSGDIPS